MSANTNSGRRKALIASVLVFLFLGGGIFVFFVFQGLGDLKGDAKTDFNYGFNVRNAVLPVFEYFGLAENEADRAEATKKRIKERGLDASLLDEPQADISDWMAKGGGGEKGGRHSGAFSAHSARTDIPKMGGGLSGPGGAGGGASKSSADISRFGGGADSGNVRISRIGGSGTESAKDKGTLKALGNVRAALGEGLRSGSAMTARSKWDQGFVSGVTGKQGGDLAYGKPGLVKLDHIKSGDIADLKTTDPGSLKIAEPGKPERDTENEAKAAAASGEKDAAKSMADAAGKAVSGAAAGGGGSGPKTADQDPNSTPPPEVLALGAKPKSEGGNYCPGGCSCGQGCTFKDSAPVYLKTSDGWNVGYIGQQTGADGKTISYVDVCKLNPGGTTPSTLVATREGDSPDALVTVTPP